MLAISNISFNEISIPDYIPCTLHLMAEKEFINDKRTLDLDILIHFIEMPDNNIVGVEIRGKPYAGLEPRLFDITRDDISDCFSLKDMCTVAIDKWYNKYMPSNHKSWTILSIDHILPIDENDGSKYFKVLEEFEVN